MSRKENKLKRWWRENMTRERFIGFMIAMLIVCTLLADALTALTRMIMGVD